MNKYDIVQNNLEGKFYYRIDSWIVPVEITIFKENNKFWIRFSKSYVPVNLNDIPLYAIFEKI